MKESYLTPILMIIMFVCSTFLMWKFTNDTKTSIIANIEKHSVHPIYGNYKKFDVNERKCEPWDSCR
jgi:hypothetical protein